MRVGGMRWLMRIIVGTSAAAVDTEAFGEEFECHAALGF